MRTQLVLLITVIFMAFSYGVFAQEKDKQSVQKLSVFQQSIEKQNGAVHFSKVAAERNLTSLLSIGGAEFDDPVFNFAPSTQIRTAGDVNGDGYADFYYTIFAGDETTEDPTDQAFKLVLYYGSEDGLSEDNSTLIRGGFNFVADVTGDGVAEGLLYEDGVLYLVVDESEGDFETIIEVELWPLLSGYVFESYGDFDGDGFSDVMVYSPRPNSGGEQHDFYMIYGAASIDDISVDTLSYDSFNETTFQYDKILYSDVDNDGTTELVTVSSFYTPDISDDQVAISVYHQEETSGLELIHRDTLSEDITSGWSFFVMNTGNIGVMDLNGNGNQELILYADSQVRIFELGDTLGEYYSESTMLEETFSASDFAIIDDYDDDGAKELLVTGESVLFITSDESLNLTSTELPMNDGDVLSFPTNPSLNRNSAGDMNGDGIADIVVAFTNADEGIYGYRAYHGTADGNFDTTSEIIFSTNDVQREFIYHSTNIGDINGDGIEDLALTYTRVVEIYLGGGSFEEPDFSIDRPNDGHNLFYSPAAGDFNGDGYGDLAVNFGSDDGSRIEIFFGGPDFNPVSDQTLLLSDIDVEVSQESFLSSGFTATANIGDINGDGMDDLIASNSWYSTNTFIYLGGESFSTVPDHIIPIGGTGYANLGDFTGNGKGNFAVSNGSDAVWILEGYDDSEGEEFSAEPVIIIPPRPQEEAQISSTWGDNITAADLNGNGRKELVITPLFHTKPNGVGAEAIYFYEGGEEADSLYDHAIALNGTDLNFESGVFGGPNLDSLAISAIGLQRIPDMNDDGRDELLISTWNQRFAAFIQSNAVLYYGKETLTEIDGEYDIVFEAPNPIGGLGVYLNSFLSSTSKSAVGDFSNNGLIDFVFTQQNDFNYKRDYAYFYEDPMSVSNEQELTQAIKGYKLDQNYPNPFNPTTRISYQLPVNSEVKLEVFDITGRLVSTVVNERQVAGSYTLNFDAAAFASGIYIYRLQADGFTQTKKMTLIK